MFLICVDNFCKSLEVGNKKERWRKGLRMGKEILIKLRIEIKDWLFSSLGIVLKVKLRVLKLNYLGFKWFVKEIIKVLFFSRMVLNMYYY